MICFLSNREGFDDSNTRKYNMCSRTQSPKTMRTGVVLALSLYCGFSSSKVNRILHVV
jgi:hypothetical protein